MATLTERDIDFILERFDATDPKIQREAMVVLVNRLADLDVLTKRIADLEAFKRYVHDRLDAMKIPADPDPQRTAETGCRIGSRLNFVETRLSDGDYAERHAGE